MKEIPPEQRPYEKCIRYGETVLTDAELLAVILRSGTRDKSAVSLAGQVLSVSSHSAYPGLSGILHLSLEELKKIPGIGDVKAVQLKCVGELSRRIACAAARPGISFNEPCSIAAYFMEKLRHEEQEHLYIMMMDTKGHHIGDYLVSRGTVDATVATPREIFVEALRRMAAGIVLVHNHPSGDPSPSSCDEEITRNAYQMGNILGIRLLDHIIIGDQKYFSFREQGLFLENAFSQDIRDRSGQQHGEDLFP